MKIIGKISKLIYDRNFDEVYKSFNLDKEDFSQLNNEGYTLLHIAAKTPNAEKLISFLLEKGFDINVRDNQGRTPSFIAVNDNRPENLKELLKYNPDLMILSDEEELVLNIASSGDSLKCVELLIDYGVDIDSKIIGESPLRDAIYNESSDELIDLLISRGANVDGVEFSIPLLAAISLDDLDRVKLLISHGADINKRNKRGENAIEFSARINKLEILEYLKN